MSLYDGVTILKDSCGKRYYDAIKYPSIDVDNNDIYFISVVGDRLDNISQDYYGNTDDYWIIAIANTLPCDSLFIPPGTQVRVPYNTSKIKQDFNTLNGIT